MTSKKSTSTEPHHTATLSRSFRSADRAATVERSLRQEAGEIPGPRATATVERTDTTVRIQVQAADLTALRAGTFTWCGLLETTGATIDGIEG